MADALIVYGIPLQSLKEPAKWNAEYKFVEQTNSHNQQNLKNQFNNMLKSYLWIK